jgi:hypothetical protein
MNKFFSDEVSEHFSSLSHFYLLLKTLLNFTNYVAFIW